MRELLLVGAGGFAGSVLRYLVTGLATQASAASRFPWGTLAVNVIGCLAIGAIAGAAEQKPELIGPQARLLLITGLLGGFTTYSAFAYETHFLLRERATLLAGVNVLAQLSLGFMAVWVGRLMVLRLGPA